MSGERLWFLDSLVILHVSHQDGGDGLSVIEHRLPPHYGPPMHIHEHEDEIFSMFEGRLRLKVGGKDLSAGPGTILRVPQGVPHAFKVISPEGARLLTITSHREFEGLVRALGRPAPSDTLPPRSGPPTPEAIATLTQTANRFGMQIVGPPLE